MTDNLSPNLPARLLSELRGLVAERVPAEAEIPRAEAARKRQCEREYEERQAWAAEAYEQAKAAAQSEYAAERRAVVARCEADYGALQRQYDDARREAESRFDEGRQKAAQELKETQWEATTIFEAAKGGSGLSLEEIQAQMDARYRELEQVHREAVDLMVSRGHWRRFPDPPWSGEPVEGNPVNLFADAVPRAKAALCRLTDQSLPRLFEGLWPLGLFLLCWLLMVPPAGMAMHWTGWQWVALSGGAALALFGVVAATIHFRARRQSAAAYLALRQVLVDAGFGRPEILAAAKQRVARDYAAVRQRQDKELKRAEEQFAATMAELNLEKQNALHRINQHYPPRLAEIAARRDRELQAADEQHARRLAEIEDHHRNELEQARRAYTQGLEANQQEHEARWREMADRWRQGVDQFTRSAEEAGRQCDRLFPDWASLQANGWQPPAEVPAAVRFGHVTVRLGQIERGVPESEPLRPRQTDFRLPALLPFPDRSALMFLAEGEGQGKAVEAMQAIMLRLLAAMPPGKVRFMIVDPVGLGENFSAFMHLADFDEKLIGSRIWTEPAQIDQRLADLTGHMENVIQLYLRNEYQTILEYNRSAGEMAEPYRVLVVANFPANFTEAAAQRLLSIVNSGARCGVFTVLSVDARQRLPRNFHLADLEARAMTLRWREGQFVWEHPDVGTLPVELEGPPPPDRFTELVRRVGAAARDAGRVEVPFECVTPQDEPWWSADSGPKIDLPLGRAGALKLQHLRLGEGTSQHVLISGKTGSGKSNLLHVLVTNLALRYGPDQVELYLVDFKKGVEFKAYASGLLPHARVIAIESEREFGLSVLERLDDELKRRGEMFRRLGVQDLAAYRAARPAEELPRALLVVDEFQELFVEDDRIAQDAALLLDRLVRQGRAFGIHVLLGSQTLAGAYSLPRATIGQMGIRIALQCSDADAHLILSEENTAARLLARPGEAIYNDAGGLFEGNHPFQVAWLPDVKRDGYLKQVAEFARKRRHAAGPPIVFEGNAPAELAANPRLCELLDASGWPDDAPEPKAWLGSAVAIKDPPAAVFSRQGGRNLLVVGHREETALGLLGATLLSLATQHRPAAEGGAAGARFYVLDGGRAHSAAARLWPRLADALPQELTVAGPAGAGEVVGQLAAEVARREREGGDDAPAVYLVVNNLGRFRELRKADDDFGFSRLDEEKPPSPARQFAEILREGPALGVHAILWCDTYNTVTRFLDRQGLRDVEMRALMHMNATDSTNLADSPAAAQLGVFRALLCDEGQGWSEKFCPYGPPPDDWLARVAARLRARVQQGAGAKERAQG